MKSNERAAIITLGLDPKGMNAGINAAKHKLRSLEQDRTRQERVGANRTRQQQQKSARRSAMIGGAVGGAVGGVVGGAASAVVGRTMDMMGDAGHEVIDVERALTRFQINAKRTSAQMAELRTTINGVSSATGVARGQILAGAAQYAALTGDGEGAAKATALFTEVSVASGAAISDVAQAAAALRTNLNLDPSQFRKAFDVLITQGKAGAIEIKQLAGELSSVAPQFAQFKGGASAEGLAELGANFQTLRNSFGSAEEARTGFMSLMTQMVKKRRVLKQFGVRIYDDKGNRRSFEAIQADMRKLNETQLTDVLRESGAIRSQQALNVHAANTAKIKKESMNSDAVAVDNAAYLASAAGRMDVSINSAKMALIEAFSPERVAKFVAALGKVASIFADNVAFAELLADSAIEFVTQDKDERAERVEHVLKDLGANASYAQRREAEEGSWINPSFLDPGDLGGNVGAFEEVRRLARRGQGQSTGFGMVTEPITSATMTDAMTRWWTGQVETPAAPRAPTRSESSPMVRVTIGNDTVNQSSDNAKIERTKKGR